MSEILAPLGQDGSMLAPSVESRIVPRALTRPQKAAVVVRLLLAEGAKLPLDSLDEATQAALTQQMAGLRLIDRATLQSVIDEFSEELEAIGLQLPGDLSKALAVLDGHINTATAARLRREAGIAAQGDPWQRLSELDPLRLRAILDSESLEVGAVLLSKLEVGKAALVLAELDMDRARRLSFAIARTGRVAPHTVERIGISLAAQLDAEPLRAFEAEPVERVGAILNNAKTNVREEVLVGLDEEDAAFAAEVRKSIFTFALIPERLSPKDVPRILKGLDQEELIQALAFAATDPATEKVPAFFTENLGRRMAEQITTGIEELEEVSAEAGEAAMMKITGEIRAKADAGEIVLQAV